MEQKLPLENELEPIFLGKFPPFPDNVKEILVKIAPILAIIGVVFGAFGLLGALVLGGGATAIGAMSYGSGAAFWISMAFLAVLVVVEALAIPKLFKRQKGGWNLMYYATLISLLNSLVTGILSGGIVGAIISILIGGIIGFWILFQIRDKYTG
ncbi:MAG: hypothetical protein U0Y10_15300 [Spirosomataceae bacterium]